MTLLFWFIFAINPVRPQVVGSLEYAHKMVVLYYGQTFVLNIKTNNEDYSKSCWENPEFVDIVRSSP